MNLMGHSTKFIMWEMKNVSRKQTATFRDMELKLFECLTRGTCDGQGLNSPTGNWRFVVWESANVVRFEFKDRQ
jgi:hypothetical protein